MASIVAVTDVWISMSVPQGCITAMTTVCAKTASDLSNVNVKMAFSEMAAPAKISMNVPRMDIIVQRTQPAQIESGRLFAIARKGMVTMALPASSRMSVCSQPLVAWIQHARTPMDHSSAHAYLAIQETAVIVTVMVSEAIGRCKKKDAVCVWSLSFFHHYLRSAFKITSITHELPSTFLRDQERRAPLLISIPGKSLRFYFKASKSNCLIECSNSFYVEYNTTEEILPVAKHNSQCTEWPTLILLCNVQMA